MLLLLPGRAAGQSGTVTDDAFLSNNANTQKLNLGGQGISLIVAGSGAMVGSPHVSVGQTTTYIKFQLLSSLPQNTPAANVQKATLKLFLSPGRGQPEPLPKLLLPRDLTQADNEAACVPKLLFTSGVHPKEFGPTSVQFKRVIARLFRL